MISKFDVLKAFRRAKEEGRDLGMVLSEDEKSVLDSKTEEYLCSIDTYVTYLRQKLHCDFECIFYEHASLTTIYRCNECGTVIFTGDERYDPNLRCPVCAGYHHWGKYYTKEDMDNDPKKREEVQLYIDWQKEMDEAEERRKASGGLYDWQVFEKKWYGKKYFFGLEMTDFGRHLGEKKKENKPWYKRMIDLEFRFGSKGDSEISYTVDKHFKIPLSPYSFYVRFIYPHTKKGREFKKGLNLK